MIDGAPGCMRERCWRGKRQLSYACPMNIMLAPLRTHHIVTSNMQKRIQYFLPHAVLFVSKNHIHHSYKKTSFLPPPPPPLPKDLFIATSLSPSTSIYTLPIDAFSYSIYQLYSSKAISPYKQIEHTTSISTLIFPSSREIKHG